MRWIGALVDESATYRHAGSDAVEPGATAAVISIDADDLPDAVYVEGSLEGDSNRSIVFIEDDVAGDALTPESDRDLRRGIEPRMRERRVAVDRAESRKRLKWVVVGDRARTARRRGAGAARIARCSRSRPIR